MTRDEARAFMGDEIYDDAIREEAEEAANVRHVLREGIMQAQLKQIAKAILELSQFSDDPGLTIGSRDNMESIVRIYSK